MQIINVPNWFCLYLVFLFKGSFPSPAIFFCWPKKQNNEQYYIYCIVNEQMFTYYLCDRNITDTVFL